MVVLVCLVRYRSPNPYEGASVYPACQNLLLAAHALGYGGALTMWHGAVEPELRSLLGIPDEVADTGNGRVSPLWGNPLKDGPAFGPRRS